MALSQEVRDLRRGLVGVLAWAAERRKPTWQLGASPPVPCVVDVHGQKALQLSPKNLEYFERGDGTALAHDESQALADELLLQGLGPASVAPIDPETRQPTAPTRFGPAVYEHRWQEGDLILWDNGFFAHSTTPVQFYRGERLMLQIMFSGERAGAAGGVGRFMNPGGGQGLAEGEEDGTRSGWKQATASGTPSGAGTTF